MTAKWNSLETFSIESATGNNNVYANGRQSIKLRLAIKVIDDENDPVKLSDQERFTITLIDYSGKEIKYRHENDFTPVEGKYGQWDWSIFNNGDYRHYPSQGTGGRAFSDNSAVSARDNTAYIDLYVRTISELPMEFGVRITREDGQKFDSRKFAKGTVTVTPESLQTYYPSDYQLVETVMKPKPTGSGRFPGGVWSLSYFRFGLGGKNLRFRSVELSPEGLYGNMDPFSLSFADMVGWVKPGERTIQYLFPIKHAPENIESAPKDGDILFVKAVVMNNNGSHYPTLIGRGAVTNCSVNAIDEYGTLHQLTLRFKNNASHGGELELV